MRIIVLALLVACGSKDKAPPGPGSDPVKPKLEPAGSGGSLGSRLSGSGSGSGSSAPDKPPPPIVKKVDGECSRKNNDVALQGACEYRCSQGDGGACAIAAANYFGGNGVRDNAAKSLEYALKACELEVAAGCGLASTLYAGARDAKIKDDAKSEEYTKKAFPLFEKACSADDGDACLTVAYWLSGKVIGGLKGVEPDAKRSATEQKHGLELQQKACDGGDGQQCEVLALSYSVGGDGIDKNEKRSFELRTKACEANYATACFDLSRDVADDKKPALLERACAADHRKACARLAEAAAAANSPRAKELRDKACKLGEAQSCISIGEEAAKTGDRAKARAMFDRACEVGSDVGCSSARQLPK